MAFPTKIARPLTLKEKVLKFFRSLFSKKPFRKTIASFPTAKLVFPNTLAQDLVAVRPLAAPQGDFHGFFVGGGLTGYRNVVLRPEKIVGNTVEEYFINLILAWNKLQDNLISHDRRHNKIMKEYCYKMKKLLEQFPEIINYYHYGLYELGLLDIKGEKRKHNFVGYKEMPKTIAGDNGMFCLWYTIYNNDKTETYVLDRPDYKKDIIIDLETSVKRMLMES